MEHPVECRSSDRLTRIAHRRMRIHPRSPQICLALCVLLATVAVRPAGVTVITHGMEGEVTGWVRPLGYAMFGEDATYYQFKVVQDLSRTYVQSVRLGGPLFSESRSGQIVVALDWSQMAGLLFFASSTEVAEALVPVLTTPGYLAELNGHSLADLPIHLVGHSRGGSVVCETARLLGERGIWVDHLTTLDPHPMGIGYDDGPARVYANVLFADNYYQQLDFFTYGEEVAGAYNRELTSLPGAYTKNHSNVHVWYHATADLAVPTYYWDADDKLQIDITSQIRSQWFVPEENGGSRTGFAFSLARRGSRLSDDRPAGFGSPPVRSGYNQLYSFFGAGDQPNRTSLALVTNVWPNPLRLDVLSPLSAPHGSRLVCQLLYQAGNSDAETVDVALYADQDHNPDNRNEHLLYSAKVPGTGAGLVRRLTMAAPVDTGRVGVGVLNLFTRLSDATRARFMYSETEPRSTTDSVVLAMEGIAVGISVGARVKSESWAAFVLEASPDCRAWSPIVTNLIVGSPFAYTQPAVSSPASMFFRARAYLE